MSNRMTTDEVMDSIFVPKKAEKTPEVPKNERTYYTIQGGSKNKDAAGNYLVENEEDIAVCAKYVLTDGKERFLIKTDGHSLYNPVSMYSHYENTPGVKRWRFEQVNKQAFEAYLRYLRSKQEVHLQHSELLRS